jgi:hypothetical protein
VLCRGIDSRDLEPHYWICKIVCSIPASAIAQLVYVWLRRLAGLIFESGRFARERARLSEND